MLTWNKFCRKKSFSPRKKIILYNNIIVNELRKLDLTSGHGNIMLTKLHAYLIYSQSSKKIILLHFLFREKKLSFNFLLLWCSLNLKHYIYFWTDVTCNPKMLALIFIKTDNDPRVVTQKNGGSCSLVRVLSLISTSKIKPRRGKERRATKNETAKKRRLSRSSQENEWS